MEKGNVNVLELQKCVKQHLILYHKRTEITTLTTWWRYDATQPSNKSDPRVAPEQDLPPQQIVVLLLVSSWLHLIPPGSLPAADEDVARQ